jgi:hypothetical protein
MNTNNPNLIIEKCVLFEIEEVGWPAILLRSHEIIKYI